MTEQLPAGRELDALIAEKVLGLVWDKTRCQVCGWRIVEDRSEGCTADSCSLRPAPQHRATEPAPYSTDIAAAWAVLQHFSDAIVEQAGGNYEVTISSTFTAHANTAAHAICLAALKAVTP